MALFDYFPYTNIHEMNLDWIIRTIKQWSSEADKHFSTIDEAIKELNTNFYQLKDYVINYLDNADFQQMVSDKLDEMLEDGSLASLLVDNAFRYTPLQGVFDGETVVRIRDRYTKPSDSSKTAGFQGGIIYSPSGEHTMEAQRYLYVWHTWSDDQDTELYTIDVATNTILNKLVVPNAQHGGNMAINYLNKSLISICRNRSVPGESRYIEFDISNPAAPTIKLNYPIGNFHLIGIRARNESRIYYIDENNVVWRAPTTSPTRICELQETNEDVTQGYCINGNFIYRISSQPSVLHTYSLLTGEKLATMELPNIINAIATQEVELVSVEGENIYVGFISGGGCVGSQFTDLSVFMMNVYDKNTSRKNIYNIGVERVIYINYGADGRNRDTSDGRSYNTFKYFEDAQNFCKGLNDVAFVLETDYPHSFYIYQYGRYNFNNFVTGAFTINCRGVDIVGLANSFSGSPIAFTLFKPWIYIREGSAKIRTLPNLNNPSGVLTLWTFRSHVSFMTYDDIQSVFFEESIIDGLSYLLKDIWIRQSDVSCYKILLVNSATLHIDIYSKVKGKIVNDRADQRLALSTLSGISSPLPIRYNSAIRSFLIPTIIFYNDTSSASIEGGTRYIDNSGTAKVLGFTVTREEIVVVPSGEHQMTEVRYNISQFIDPPTNVYGLGESAR